MSTQVETPLRFETSDGRTIYAMCLEVFPDFYGNVYLIDDGNHRTLVDCGSPRAESNQNLVAAFASLEDAFGYRCKLADVDCLLITHGHMDHFGGIRFVREHTDAPIGVHVLDQRILSHYEERVIVASKQLAVYLQRCGLSEGKRQQLMAMYKHPKSHYRSVPVDFLLEEGDAVRPVLGGTEVDLQIGVTHVPGHCPGQVCLRLGDHMLTADHVLGRITPHQAPESITLNMGLGHYLESLDKIAEETGIVQCLGGHEPPFPDLQKRVQEIKDSHDERLGEILDYCRTEPRTVADVSRALFKKLSGYTVLLGLEEAGAHVEYLHQRGELVAANISELESEEDPVVQYVVP